MHGNRVCLSATVLVLACSLLAVAQQSADVTVPPMVNFGGMLRDGNGKALTGVVGVTFYLYKDQQGGAPLWIETQNVQPDKSGHYSVMLGSTTSEGLTPSLFASGEARWLGVQVQGQEEQPRVMLLSVPYAMKAGDAQTVGGLPASAFALAKPAAPSSLNTPSSLSGASSILTPALPCASGATNTVTTDGTAIAGLIPKFNPAASGSAPCNIEPSQITDNGTNVGIGTTAPAAKLDVSGSATVRGTLNLPATGASTATAGKNSQALTLTASSFKNGTGGGAVNQNFLWQAEPRGNNTAVPSGTLNLLFGSGKIPTETGLKISSNGIITFAPGQTLPTIVGNENVTGNLSATGSLSGASANFTGPVSTGNETVNGNISTTGSIATNGNVHILGNLRVEGPSSIGSGTPLASWGGQGDFAIDAPGVVGGRFIVKDGMGNVGIGTSMPQTVLHVNHAPPSGGLDIVDLTSGGATDVASLLIQNTSIGGQRLRAGAGTGVAYLASSTGLNFVTADTGTPSFPSSPAMTIDNSGNVSVQHNLSIGGDTPMSSNPHMSFSGMFFGSLCQAFNECGGFGSGTNWGGFVADKNIAITRLTATINDQIDPTCLPGEVGVGQFGTPFTLVSVSLPALSNFLDSQIIPPVAVRAGTQLFIFAGLANPAACHYGASAGGNIFVNVQYVIQ